MMIDGFPTCDNEDCIEFFTGPYVMTLEGKTYHHSCLYPCCNDCLAQFTEFEPREKEGNRYFHPEGMCPQPKVNNLIP